MCVRVADERGRVAVERRPVGARSSIGRSLMSAAIGGARSTSATRELLISYTPRGPPPRSCTPREPPPRRLPNIIDCSTYCWKTVRRSRSLCEGRSGDGDLIYKIQRNNNSRDPGHDHHQLRHWKEAESWRQKSRRRNIHWTATSRSLIRQHGTRTVTGEDAARCIRRIRPPSYRIPGNI